MKYFVLIVFALLANAAKAQGYLPILTEGKVWNCVDYNDCQEKNRFSMEVCGDTAAYGYDCKKIYFYRDIERTQRMKFVYKAYEEGGRLYALEPGEDVTNRNYDTPCLLCDFNLEVGDSAWFSHVTKVDTIEVRGVQRKRITLQYPLDFGIWVEGIGPFVSSWPSNVEKPTCHLFYYIESCYENGELIFTRDDFFAPAVSAGISGVAADEAFDGRIYDLSGRIVEQPMAKGIYIRNGRKFVWR